MPEHRPPKFSPYWFLDRTLDGILANPQIEALRAASLLASARDEAEALHKKVQAALAEFPYNLHLDMPGQPQHPVPLAQALYENIKGLHEALLIYVAVINSQSVGRKARPQHSDQPQQGSGVSPQPVRSMETPEQQVSGGSDESR